MENEEKKIEETAEVEEQVTAEDPNDLGKIIFPKGGLIAMGIIVALMIVCIIVIFSLGGPLQ